MSEIEKYLATIMGMFSMIGALHCFNFTKYCWCWSCFNKKLEEEERKANDKPRD